ncbi:MAG: hypothetical protein HY815_27890, partial [Candidatus Riflebacteria bacterium]|nr:hypothetical protein [Candidatus Riflebacteria bacterium]
ISLSLSGNVFKVSGSVADLRGEKKLDLKIQGQGFDPSGLLPLLPAAAQKTLSRSGFHGGQGARVTVKGKLASPIVDASLDLAGAEFVDLAGFGPARIPKGTIKYAEQALSTDGLYLQVAGVPITVVGGVQMGEPPVCKLRVTGDRVDLAALGRALSLPEGTSLGGNTALDLQIDGPVTGPQLSGKIALAGLSIRVPAVASPIVGVSGELQLEGEDLSIADGAVRLGSRLLKVSGKVAQFARAPRVEGAGLSGQIDLGDVWNSPTARLAGRGQLDARASGPARALRLDGMLTAPAVGLLLAKGGKLEVTYVRARFSREGLQTTVTVEEGKVASGSLTGRLTNNEGVSPPRVAVSMNVAGADLATVVAGLGKSESEPQGNLSLSFNGSTGGQPGSLSGTGKLQIQNLSVDLSSSQKLIQLDRYAMGAGLASSVVSSFFKNDKKVQKLAGERGPELEFYRKVLAEVRKRNRIGAVSAPIALSRGVLKLDPIQGEHLSGRFQVDLASTGLVGQIAHLDLGRVRIPDIGIGGTLAQPDTRVAREKIMLDGKAYSASTSEAGDATEGQPAQEESPESRVINKLLGKKKPSAAPSDAGSPASDQPDDQSPELRMIDLLTGKKKKSTASPRPEPAPQPEPEPAASPEATEEPQPEKPEDAAIDLLKGLLKKK